MKSLHVELPEKLHEQLQALVGQGWFRSPDEAVTLALLQFLRPRRLELLEQFQRDDIAWALTVKKAAG